MSAFKHIYLPLITSNTEIWFHQMKSTKNKNGQQWCIQVWDPKKNNLFHLPQTVVLPLLATTSGATDCEWDREEWETVGKCK